MIMPNAPNDRCSLDFVSDQLTDGRRFRILTWSCEYLALVADTSLSGTRVTREPKWRVIERGEPNKGGPRQRLRVHQHATLDGLIRVVSHGATSRLASPCR